MDPLDWMSNLLWKGIVKSILSSLTKERNFKLTYVV